MDTIMANVTAKQLADIMGVEYLVACSILRYMVRTGQAEVVAKVFHKSGKGAPMNVFKVNKQLKINIPRTEFDCKIIGHQIRMVSKKKRTRKAA